MSKNILALLTVSIILFACRKEQVPHELAETCLKQTANPAGSTYDSDSLFYIAYAKKHCGLLPLSAKNYWIYEDSIFDNGSFLRVQYDTLRFSSFRVSADNIIWWETDLLIGLPAKLYSNDSSLFELENRMFIPGIMDAKKSYSLFEGDSVKYLTSFGDIAAQGKSQLLNATQCTPSGNYNECILFEKNARNYRREQVIFKPGIGVIKFIQEIAPMGTRVIKLQRVATLIKFHIE